MDNSEQIFSRPFNGTLRVIIEGVGEMGIEALGEPILLLIYNVEAFLSEQGITIQYTELAAPYEIVSFDETAKRIVVRRKAA